MHFLLQIFTCGFPPLEDRDISLQVLAGHDFFGGGTFTKEETVSFLLPQICHFIVTCIFIGITQLKLNILYLRNRSGK